MKATAEQILDKEVKGQFDGYKEFSRVLGYEYNNSKLNIMNKVKALNNKVKPLGLQVTFEFTPERLSKEINDFA